MGDSRLEVQQWLLKSRSDLESARVLFERELYDTAVYHCQQSAEKALKSYLAWCELPVMKVHDLTLLVKECVLLDRSFFSLVEVSEILTPYAIAFRYPGGMLVPEIVDVEEAIELSEKVLDFVENKFKELK